MPHQADFKVYVTGTTDLQSRSVPQIMNLRDHFTAALQNPDTDLDFELPRARVVAPSNYIQTRTAVVPYIRLRMPHWIHPSSMAYELQQLQINTQLFVNGPTSIADQYDTFYVPKASGGYREINAPKENLKHMQYQLLNFFQHILKALPHNAAFAYIKGRSTVQALQQHQANESQWFLKLDIKDFFPSCTLNFVCQQLQHIYPICFLEEHTVADILRVAMLNGAMPQGAPTSPFLSNLVMVPVDYEINKRLYNHNRHHFVYTRYADDLLISCKEKFSPGEITEIVSGILESTPFRIKDEKTRFGSRSGRNWNLGLMLNKDNDITVGYKEKQRLRAAIFSLYKDQAAGVQWSPQDIAILVGQISYLKMVEPQTAKEIIEKYETKFGISFKDVTRV